MADQTDTDMTPRGRTQATGNGKFLAGLIPDPENFDYVCSPLRRTRETMERIRSELGLDRHGYKTDPRLMEVNFGDWQGHTFAELEAKSPGTTAQRFIEKWDFLPPGDNAESYEMMLSRFRPWFESVTRKTVCVIHGGIIRALFRLVNDMPRNDAASVDVPQDRVLKYENSRVAWL